MSERAYDALAFLYDYLQKDLSSEKWADFLFSLIQKNISCAPSGENNAYSVCDLGCGTAKVSISMSKLGFEVQGVDQSPFMLDQAVKNCEKENLSLFFSCQDIRRFSLPEKADVFLCLLDTINHILTEKDLKKVFESVRQNLQKGGLFIFDMVTPFYLENRLGNQMFYTIEEDFSLFWENRFLKKSRMSYSDISLYIRSKGELFRREELQIKEKAYSVSEIESFLAAAGLSLKGIYGDLKKMAPREEEERIFFVAEKSE